MKAITIRFTDEQYEALKKASKKDERSINKFVTIAVDERVEKIEKLSSNS